MRVFMCEKCEARSRVCVCLETLCMDLMHVMDSIHSVYGVSSVIQGGLKALSPPNHVSLTLTVGLGLGRGRFRPPEKPCSRAPLSSRTMVRLSMRSQKEEVLRAM